MLIPKRNLAWLFCLIFCFSIFGKTVKYEMRGNWLATVYRLNWPPSYAVITSPTDEVNQKKQKDAMITMLDAFAAANQNIVFFQVRSRCDAMYKSSYEPWSADLVTTRGLDPGYDPLQFVIEEGHKRGLEIHAWVNPYRFESQAGQWSGLAGDYASTNPDWIIQVGNATILNPGKPEVRDRITQVIEEIVQNYDVDGVVFDDYFYLQGITTQDATEQQLYKPEGMSLGDWRRDNVNKMIAQVYEMIQTKKPYVRFGVSPAGIWGGSAEAAYKYGVTQPIGIGNGYAYNGIYCDPLAWLSEASVDYISPQIYWTTGSGSTDYGVLAEWWSNIGQRFSRHFYSSQSISDLDPWKIIARRTVQIKEYTVPLEGLSGLEYGISQAESMTRAINSFGYAEVGKQIDCNRQYDKNNAPGSIFYSAKKFLETKGFIPFLLENHYKWKALPPALFWKKNAPMEMVKNLDLNNGVLSWQCDLQDVRFAVYAIPVNEPLVQMANNEYLRSISYTTQYELKENISVTTHAIGVSVFDRYGNESPITILNKDVEQLSSTNLLLPKEGSLLTFPTVFSWEEQNDASMYRLEIAEDKDFSTLKAMAETQASFYSTDTLFPLNPGKEYYWRVVSLSPGYISGISSIRKFNLFDFSILSPLSGDTDVSTTPLIEWTEWTEAKNYLLEISTSQNFDNTVMFSKLLNATSFEIPEEVLKTNTPYYLRVTAFGTTTNLQTPVVSFNTAALTPTIPVIVAPIHESHVSVGKVSVIIDKNPNATAFRYELSQSESFPPRNTNIQTVDAFNYQLDYDLLEGVYFVRVQAYYGSAKTEYSNVVKFTVSPTDGIIALSRPEDIYISQDETTHYLHLPLKCMPLSSLRIYDDQGRLIRTEDNLNNILLESQQFDLKTTHFAKGGYLLILNTGTNVITRKLYK